MCYASCIGFWLNAANYTNLGTNSMPTAKIKRRRLLIDGPVQIGLVKRIVLHWVTFLAAVVVVLPLYRAIVTGDFATPLSQRVTQVGIESAILLTLFAALLPYFIYDTLRLTNRFAGPMYRLHQTIRAVAKNKDAPPLSFREGDYWHTVAKDFNTMLESVQERAAQPSAEHDTEDLREEALVS